MQRVPTADPAPDPASEAAPEAAPEPAPEPGRQPGAGAALRRLAISILLPVVLGVAGCDLPRDPDGTLQRVRGGEIRIGLVGPDPAAAAARAAASAFAGDLRARPVFVRGDSHDLVEQMRQGRLDLIAALPAETPFKARIGLSRSYPAAAEPGRDLAWGVPRGENAFLGAVDRFLYRRLRDGSLS